MSKRVSIGLVVTLCVVLLPLGMWLLRSNDRQGSPNRIGAILPLTGPGAPFGESSRNALLLAAQEINANAEGPLMEVLIQDGMTDPRASVTAFNRLHDVQNTRLFITTVSNVSLALAPLADRKESLLFANASHPQVTEGRKFVLRYSNTAPDEARMLLDFIVHLDSGPARLYVIALNDDYGRAYVQELRKMNARYPKITLLGEEFYDRAASDFRTAVTKAISSTPDAIVLIGFGRSLGLCLRQLRELGYGGPYFASLGFILTADAVTAAGEAIRNGYYLNFAFVSDPGAQAFRNRYRQRYGADPAPNAVIDYDTLFLLAQGLRAVGNEPSKLSTYFRSLERAHLPSGEVTISPHGDIVAPVRVMPVPSTGSINLWDDQH